MRDTAQPKRIQPTTEELQREIDALVQHRSHLLSLLRHAVQRNHIAPEGCTPCEEIEKELEGLPY